MGACKEQNNKTKLENDNNRDFKSRVIKPDNEGSSMDKSALINTACSDLLSYGLWGTKTKIKNQIKKYIFRKPTEVEDLIFWPTGFLAAGLWSSRQSADSSLRQKIDISLSDYFTRWDKKRGPISYLDDLLAGETFLAVYEEYDRSGTDNGIIGSRNAEQYRKAIERLAEYALLYPGDAMGSLPYRANQKNDHIYVDAIGMICPFLYEYGNFFHNNKHMELSVKQIVNFLAYGMDGSTGLPYHGYAMHTTYKYGIVGWGRAVGWLLRGMAGCMVTEYGLERLKDSYIALVDTALSYQRKDGYFSWQLQAADGPADTSATGMICAAVKRGIDLGILADLKYDSALQAGTNAIEKSTRAGVVYDCSGECEGFGRYPQTYGAYPWALGPALML